ncbi:single-stranded-DNA-specific exonuclease RecJ [Lacibacter sediminis]|uniref:Single-stranded-DNA-specific exonuclease RecJ n=1 Tax=Lacibacter sediminis TaxID=2760713 RepID=A0A7G5XIR4_9BACT|nr:single-stranded-DNA-specific exonuclease RecJ [Lacibacter sediminis]QNA45367.1 single-stranded-DNA-specific exonuclease RecJ [Lacibacter sediminis]
MQKRWTFLKKDAQRVDALAAELKIHSVLCSILVQRGFNTFEKAKQYFRPQLSDLHDPWLMKDMQKAVDRLLHAFNSNEKILVFGDYDVDGTTSVACMYQFLCSVYDPTFLDFYIPHRYREGYGVSKQGIDFAKTKGFSLIVSLDCGIKSVELIAYAKELGIDFIVCDHHLPDAEVPAAVAILNPKQKDCNYPYKELCGCGVGFKLITALAQTLNLEDEHVHRYLDLVATAIAADIVPMTGENRILAFHGLKRVNEQPSYGIKALMFLSGVKNTMHINNLVFLIAPRVNAAGRMDDARKAVQMFIASTYEEALTFAEMLHADNDERKEADMSITEEALAIINGNEQLKTKKSTVLYQSHWHKGVVGIVASRLTEHYYRPTIVLTQSGDYAAGSARSVNGFNLYEAIHACREHLLGYGGHFAAAGLTLMPENVDAFAAAFEKEVSRTIKDEQLIPEIIIDEELQLADIKPGLYNIIKQMEPFGPENMRPVFVSKKVRDNGFSKIVKDQHLRLVVKQNDTVLTGIFFRAAHLFPVIQQGAFDVVYTIDENEWNGTVSLQLKVIDIRPSTD